MTDFKKAVIGAVVSLFVAMLFAGLTIWKNVITRNDVEAIVDAQLKYHAPVSQDDLQQIRILIGEVNSLKVEQARSSTLLQSKLEMMDMKLELIRAAASLSRTTSGRVTTGSNQ